MSDKLKLLTSAASIEKAIIGIHETGQSLQATMHLVACSVLQHVGKNRDVRIMHKLFNAMPEMSRKNSLKDWFNAYGNVSIDGDDIVLKSGEDANKIKLAEAMADPFWKHSPEKDYKPLDIGAAIASLMKRIEKDTAKTGTDHSQHLQALRAITLGVKPIEQSAGA
jgi:hypothetical protein